MCNLHKAEAFKFYENGISPLASGIHIKSMQKIDDLIDHLEPKAHQVTTEAEQW
jgi:hypothetical protein